MVGYESVPGLRMATRSVAAELNSSCFCVTLDRSQVAASRNKLGAFDNIVPLDGRLSMFADSPVFVGASQMSEMLSVMRSIEAVVRNPSVAETALMSAPLVAPAGHPELGVLMGYDFHLGGGHSELIEVNTNAGGAFLNALALDAQRACCPEVERTLDKYLAGSFQDAAVAMFRKEWSLARGAAPLRRIAIVDDDPEGQFLYPEFLVARDMLRSGGMESVIVDARDLVFKDGKLSANGEPVDLVYNRLTDFYFTQSEHAALRGAYLADAVVVTPNPRQHALYANKRNLVLLSDPEFLRAAGVDHATVDVLTRGVPRTVAVTSGNAASLWLTRDQWFFKPLAGHAGKAVYRGDKLTRRTWSETILCKDYIAQRLAPPATRSVRVDGVETTLKMDVRLYTYGGTLLLAAARLFSGQTTNFRTPGGGFAPVCVV